MARIYEDTAGDTMKKWADPEDFDFSDMAAAEIDLVGVRALSDSILIRIATGQFSTVSSLSDFKKFLDAQIEELRDLQDYETYVKADAILDAFDHAWFLPIAVESFCGENIGAEATLSIDGDNDTWWQHTVDEQHNIVYELRAHTKRIDRIRFRLGSTSNAREQLESLSVRVAKTVANLDDLGNEVLTNVNIPTSPLNDWVEVTFTSPHNGRFIKLADFQSANNFNTIRIREIQVRVITQSH